MKKIRPTPASFLNSALYIARLRVERHEKEGADVARAIDVLRDVVHVDMHMDEGLVSLTSQEYIVAWNKLRYARRLVAPHTHKLSLVKRHVMPHGVLRRQVMKTPNAASGLADHIVGYIHTDVALRRLILHFIYLQGKIFDVFRIQSMQVCCHIYFDLGPGQDDLWRVPPIDTPYKWDWSIREPVLADTAYVGQFSAFNQECQFQGVWYPRPDQQQRVTMTVATIRAHMKLCARDLLYSRSIPSPATTDYHPYSLVFATVLVELQQCFDARRTLENMWSRLI